MYGPSAFVGDRPLSGILNIDNKAGALSYSLAPMAETGIASPAATFVVMTCQIPDSAQAGDYELALLALGSVRKLQGYPRSSKEVLSKSV